MSEEENKNVVEQAQQEVVQPSDAADASAENVGQGSQDQQEVKARNDQEYNWAEARKKMQELDRQNREMAEKLARIEQPKVQNPPEEDIGIKDDDLVEGRYIKDLNKKIKSLESYIKQKEVSSVDERLQLKFPDFNEIVNEENIEFLKQNEPELAITLSHNPDPYAQGVAAYKLMKKLSIGAKPEKMVEKEKAVKNSQKPLSVNAVPKQSALGNVQMFENGLTKELKDQLYKEMKECAKRA